MDADTPPPDQMIPWRLLALGLVPLCGAFWQTDGVPTGREVALAPAQSLAFDQYHVNLREVPPEPRIPVMFGFQNLGIEAIQITKLQGSCGCLQPRLLNGEGRPLPTDGPCTVPSQARYSLYVDVSTAMEAPGPHDYSVEVTYFDPQGQSQVQQLDFSLIIPNQKVLVEPSQVLFYQLSGAPDSRQILVTDARGKELTVTAARLSRPIDGVELTVGERVRSPEGNWQTTVTVAVPAEVPAERQTAFVVLETSDPDFPKLRIPLMVQGRPAEIQQVQALEAVPELPAPRQ